MLPMFLAVIDQTIVATALPAIASSLGEVERVSRGKKTKGRAFLLLFARRLKAEERAGARADTTTGREERSERAPQGVPNLNSFISRTRPTLVPKRVVWKMEG